MNLRFSFTPYPVVGMPTSTLRRYIEGDDPVSSKSLVQELVDALTKPLTSREIDPERPSRLARPRLVEPGSEDDLQRLFLENGWTDGLPIILPTEERVAEMLTGTSHAPDEFVGRMTVTTTQERLEYTVESGACFP
jgi:hypothetical protein